MSLVVTILGGGQGKRMNSSLPKILHLLHNRPMIQWIIEEVQKLNPIKIIVVVNPRNFNQIKDSLNIFNITYIVQPRPLGTADAVKWTLKELNQDNINLILNGDSPLIKAETLRDILLSYNGGLQFTGIELQNPYGCVRIFQENGKFQRIIEEKDCLSEQRTIKLVNTGIYVVTKNILDRCLPLIENNNASREYYLPDLGGIALQLHYPVNLYILPTSKEKEITNVNTSEQLIYLNKWST